MSQGSYNVPTGGTVSMVSFATDMNAAYDALATFSSGSSTPANGPGSAPLEFQAWFDTTLVNFPVFRFFDGVNWDRVGTLDVANSNWLPQLGGGSATVTSAATTNLGSNPQTFLTISGTATITSFGSSAQVGEMKQCYAAGAFTITNSANIVCPSGANIVAASGDSFVAVYNGSGKWTIVGYSGKSSPLIPYSGGIWTNGSPAATVSRLDRLLVGTATVNSGDTPTTTKDWLETLIPQTTSVAQMASISPLAGIGVLGASRTSDASRDALGNTGFVNNNVASGLGWAFYGEAWCNAASTRFTATMELDIVNKQTPVVSIDPWNLDPGAECVALWLASGGTRSGAQPASAALAILANGSTFDKGIIVQEGALTASPGVAIALPTDYQIAWYSTGVPGVLGSTITMQSGATGGLAFTKVKTVGNGTQGPMNMGSAGPAGSNAGVQEWLVVTNLAGTTRYIPCF